MMNSGSISTKSQKVVAALGVATMLFMVTSCSNGNAQVAASPDASSTASASPSVAAIPSGPKLGDVINGIPTKTELANDGKGDYIQTTISDDDPAMKFNPALASPDVTDAFTAEEIADAQKFIMTFIAEEGIDSVINNNTSDAKNVDAWWAKNKDKIDPAYQNEFLGQLKSEDLLYTIVMRTNHRTNDLVYGKDTTRVTKRQITPTIYYVAPMNGVNYVRFDATGNFTMATKVGDTIQSEDTSASFNYTVRKSNSEHGWMISGFTNTFTISRLLY